MDDRIARSRRLAAAGILQDLLGYTALDAVRAATDLTDHVYRELQLAADDLNHNRGVCRALAAMESPRPSPQPKPYHLFAEPQQTANQ